MHDSFLSFWVIFCHTIILTTQKNKILKKWKKTPVRYHNFILVYHKWQSYDVRFLRYGVQHNFFVILDYFLPFTSLTTWKIKILKTWKLCQEILSFYTCIPKMTTMWFMVPERWSMRDEDITFCQLELFFVLFPH